MGRPIGAASPRANPLYEPERLRRLSESGMTCAEIAAAIGAPSEEQVRRAMVRRGIPRQPARARPEHNAFWTGGVIVDPYGYLLVHRPEHPDANAGGYVRQHRLVAEQMLGRRLLRTEVVDHVNGDTSDNRPENLRVFHSNAEHLRATRTGRRKLGPRERALLTRWAVERATRRAAAIRQVSGSGAGR